MSFADYLAQTFPGVRITSGRRDPNSRLGRANPRSWHNQGRAWDTAPVEGLTYEQYVDRIKQDGWDVLEARDEVNNPSRHATGPHWHVAVGGRKEPQVNGLASLFGQRPNYQTPPYNPGVQQPQGLAELLGQGAIQPQLPELTAPQANLPKPGAFAKGGKGWQIMGIIGDALQAMGGGQGTYMPAMMDIREREELGRQKLAELMAAREAKQADREAALQDWQLKQEYERNNPAPPSDANLLQWYQGLSPQEQQAYAAMQDVRNPIAVSGPTGTYRVPRGYGQQPTNSIQPGAVEDGYVYVGGDPANPSSWRQQ